MSSNWSASVKAVPDQFSSLYSAADGTALMIANASVPACKPSCSTLELVITATMVSPPRNERTTSAFIEPFVMSETFPGRTLPAQRTASSVGVLIIPMQLQLNE